MTDFTFDTQSIDSLIEQVKNTGIYKLKLKCEKFEIEIQTAPPHPTVSIPPLEQTRTAVEKPVVPPTVTSPATPETGQIVKSPIVGTFYSSPSPDQPPFVKVGQSVKEGDTLFIIESMKLMNEIKSEYNGKVTKILVESGEGVEYHQPILVIE